MNLQQFHSWEPTGVTAYPLTHPIVGQTDFYTKLKHWLPLVSHDVFAHVFAVVAPWGVGKSRLGYEVVAQVNGKSKGWKVRGKDGSLIEAQLFDREADREQYLALYIRYSQVAHRQLNLDNWFAPAVYKALHPLAGGNFDASIQHRIAKETRDRFDAEGHDLSKLAAALELDKDYGEAIYTDTGLATRLCTDAYQVLRGFGVEYVIIILDELETAAERATGGLEADVARAMDGKSITMLRKVVENLKREDEDNIGRVDIEKIGKAIKEEDARARLPWLRFIALCSPAIGDELKDVQSTDRRFEIMDLDRNAFADVSAFVHSLEAEGRLMRRYPPGLIEAAYMMSGANFGWFNVIMAVVDQALRGASERESQSLSWVFQRAIEIQERIGRYVLDRRSLEEINVSSELREVIAEIVFGQQPLPVSRFQDGQVNELLAVRNAHNEMAVIRYHRFDWSIQACSQILIDNRFQRLSGTSRWTAPGIPESIDVERLLDDLHTLAVHESTVAEAGVRRLLLPGSLPEFLQLLDLIHPHPAVEETGRTLWMSLAAADELPGGEATHVGPSIEMLRRLDIRLRKASVGAVLRDPDENEAFMTVQDEIRAHDKERARRVLTGCMRVLDNNWNYDPEPAGLGDEVQAIATAKDGLVDFKGLWLHPRGFAVLVWVNGDQALEILAKAIADDHRKNGRYPVVALTTNYELAERFEKSTSQMYKKARDSIVIAHVNSAEESALLSIGMPSSEWKGFRLRPDGFTTRFTERLNRIRNPLATRIRDWRHRVSERGRIAWPIRPTGPLKPESLKLLIDSWRIVMLDNMGKSWSDLGEISGLNCTALMPELDRLGHSPAAAPKGYGPKDAARLWVGQGKEARPETPPFLLQSIVMKLFQHQEMPITFDNVKADWYWGFVWDSKNITDIYQEWMTVAKDLGWVEAVSAEKKKTQYVFSPRKALQGKLDAARNWLEEDYPNITRRLADVLGSGVIEQWFSPPTGSKYLHAVERLQQAAERLAELDVREANPPDEDDFTACQEWFLQVTRLRLRIRDLIALVYDQDKYKELSEELEARTLTLTEQGSPLWERIGRAELFVNAIQRIARRIRKRIPSLGEELRQAVAGIHAFPIKLFTRPLAKIDHIVDAGMTGDDPLCTTKRVQHIKSDTLAYYLKELRVADAMDSIRKLARELGVTEHPTDDLPVGEIKGAIVTGFHELVKRYTSASSAVLDLAGRISQLADMLMDAPTDFMFPTSVNWNDVREKPNHISGVLKQSVEDDVEVMLDIHDEEMNLGRFEPLFTEVRLKLLDVPEREIKGLEGRVRTIENAVTAYREQLLRDETLHLCREGYNALRRALNQNPVELPQLRDLEARSLRDGRIYIDGLGVGWGNDGAKLLSGTGVSFRQWLKVVQAVKAQRELELSAEQVNALVAAGFIRRVYALGGGIHD